MKWSVESRNIISNEAAWVIQRVGSNERHESAKQFSMEPVEKDWPLFSLLMSWSVASTSKRVRFDMQGQL